MIASQITIYLIHEADGKDHYTFISRKEVPTVDNGYAYFKDINNVIYSVPSINIALIKSEGVEVDIFNQK